MGADEVKRIVRDKALEQSSVVDGDEVRDSGEDLELISDLGFNSLSFIQLIINLEKEFDITFAEDLLVMSKVSTVEKISDVVIDCLKKKGELHDE